MAKFKSKKHFASKNSFLNNSSKSISKVKNSSASFLSTVSEKFSFLKWLDPFTYVDLFVMPKVKKITDSSAVEFGVNVFFALLFAWIIYTMLGIIFGSSTPLVIVYSASMENTFFRGDVMALSFARSSTDLAQEVTLDRELKNVPVSEFISNINYEGSKLKSLTFDCGANCTKEIIPNTNGNVVVYSAFPSGLPIIHRAIVQIHANDGDFILTKGDNFLTNPTFDQDCGKVIPELNATQKQCITLYPVPVSELQGKSFFKIPLIGCVKLWLMDDLFSVISTGSPPKDFKGIC